MRVTPIKIEFTQFEECVAATYLCPNPKCNEKHVLGTLETKLFETPIIRTKWIAAMLEIAKLMIEDMAERAGVKNLGSLLPGKRRAINEPERATAAQVG